MNPGPCTSGCQKSSGLKIRTESNINKKPNVETPGLQFQTVWASKIQKPPEVKTTGGKQKVTLITNGT